jgi:hypothetical protein
MPRFRAMALMNTSPSWSTIAWYCALPACVFGSARLFGDWLETNSISFERSLLGSGTAITTPMDPSMADSETTTREADEASQ